MGAVAQAGDHRDADAGVEAVDPAVERELRDGDVVLLKSSRDAGLRWLGRDDAPLLFRPRADLERCDVRPEPVSEFLRVDAIRPIPALAYIPLVIVWIGIGEPARGDRVAPRSSRAAPDTRTLRVWP